MSTTAAILGADVARTAVAELADFEDGITRSDRSAVEHPVARSSELAQRSRDLLVGHVR